MISQVLLSNLTPWLIQSVLIATVAAILPLLFRISHPKSQLTYYHSVLCLCFALPFIQSWHEPIAIVTGSPRTANAAPQASTPSWEAIVFGIVLVGIAARLCWLGIGLWHLRRYKKRAVLLLPVPRSIREARRLTGADARICVSADIPGPATLGHIDPVVLLPKSFQSLDADSQRSIMCHELLHVRRGDWFSTIVEEFVTAVLWFNPGVWWLVAQAKLAREQLIDAEVVRLTAREPYIEALLSMAVVSRKRWALPAAPFFTEEHLVRRMRMLLSGSRRSAVTLCISYASIGILLCLASWGAFLCFPLMGETQVVLASRPPINDVVFHAREVPYAIAGGQHATARNFTVAVEPPPRPERHVVFFERKVNPADVVIGVEAMRVPPPPLPPRPPSVPLRVEGGELLPIPPAFGFRVFRPGEKATPEDIQRLREALGENAEVDIQQAADGTVQKIRVQSRRLSNEANTIRFLVLPAPAAESANAGDSVD